MFEGSVIEGSPPTYIKGDIVWVKLSGYWWPGEVKNEEDLPSDMLSDFKKRPLVIVKFFEEDSYEYIKHWSNIHPYNCEKKINFIKKGMAGFRAKLPHLATFPRDIGTAEEKTNGNPNILSQPEYLPNKKINYDEIFGDATSKKGKSSSAVRKSVPKGNDSLITHRRFLGNDDYKAYIMIQPDSDNEEPEEVLVCHSCSFSTSRPRVLLWHSRIHIEGLYITKRKSKKVKHIELSDSDSETVGAVVQQPKPKQRKKKVAADASKSSVEFTNLLEEWDDTDEETEEIETPEKSKKSSKTKNLKPKVGDNDTQANKVTPNGSSDTSKVLDNSSDFEGKKTQDDIKNCFDFDEEEDEEDFLFPASTGRKIPRVIPEKPRASISELMEQNQIEDEASKAEPEAIEKVDIVDDSQVQEKPPKKDDTSLENTFKELMDETEVPVLENLAQTLKPEQNFHDARTIKFPDKGGTTLKETASPRSGTSKKRFITSFEDFEAGFRKIEEDTRKEKEENESIDSKPTPSQQALEVSDKVTLQDSVKLLNVDEGAKDDTQKLVLEPNHQIADLARDKTAVETRTKHRRVRQLVIGEDSEEFIEFATEPETEKTVELVQQISDDGAIAVDAALEALTKDIGISPIEDNKVQEILELQVQKSEISLEQLRKDLEGTSDGIEPEVEQKDYSDKFEHTKCKKSKDADQKKKKHTSKKRKSKSCSKSPAAVREPTMVSDGNESSARKELIGNSPKSNVITSEEKETVEVSKTDEAAEGPSSGSLDSVSLEPSADANQKTNTNLQVCEQNIIEIEDLPTESIAKEQIESSIQAEVLLKPVLRRGRSRKHSQEDTGDLEGSVKNEKNQPNSVILSEATPSRNRKNKLQKSTSEGEALALGTQELDKNVSGQDLSPEASPLIEKSILSNNEHVSPKSAKKTKQKREEIHKSEEIKPADNTRRTRSHNKKELSHTDDESAPMKEDAPVAIKVDDGNKSVSIDSKPQDDINLEALNSVSSISDEIALSSNTSKIRKSSRRKSNKRDKTVSPDSQIALENDSKSSVKLSEKETDTDKLQKTTKTQESGGEVPAIGYPKSDVPEEPASLKTTSFAEKSPRRLRRKARGNAEDTCATLAVEGSKRKSENVIEPTKSADIASDNIIKDLTMQSSDCTEALPDKIVSKTRSGKTLRIDGKAVAGKDSGTDTVEFKGNLDDADTKPSSPDDVSCKLTASNTEQKRPIEDQLKETCSGLIEKSTSEIKNQEPIFDFSKELESIADIPLPDKPPSKRRRSQKLEHEIAVDVLDKRSSTYVSDDQSQSKRITRSSRISNFESKVSVEKVADVQAENIDKSNKSSEASELDKSVSICDIASKTEKHASRPTPSKRHTRRSEQNQTSVRDREKMQLIHPATASASHISESSSQSDKFTAFKSTECKEDKLPIIQKTLPSKERRRSKIQRSQKVSHKTDLSSKVEESTEAARIDSKINESACDVGLQENQETKTQLSARKQDVCSVTGIVSDVTYGRKAKEVRSGASKAVKNRWDVVTSSCNNQKSFESQAEPDATTEGGKSTVEPVPSVTKPENHNNASIEDAIQLEKQTVEASKLETTTEATLGSNSSDAAGSDTNAGIGTCGLLTSEALGEKTQEAKNKDVFLGNCPIDAVEKSDDKPQQILLENSEVHLIDSETSVLKRTDVPQNATAEASMEFSTTSTEDLEPPTKRCSRKSTAKSFTKSPVLIEIAQCSLESENRSVDIPQEVLLDNPQSESSTNTEINSYKAIVTGNDCNVPKISCERPISNDRVDKKANFNESCFASGSENIQIRPTEQDANIQMALDDQQTTDLEVNIATTIVDQEFYNICSVAKMEYVEQSLSSEIEVVTEPSDPIESIEGRMGTNEEALLVKANEGITATSQVPASNNQQPLDHTSSDNLLVSIKPVLVLGEEIHTSVIPSIAEENKTLSNEFSEEFSELQTAKPDHRETTENNSTHNESEEQVKPIPDTLEHIETAKEDLEPSHINEVEKDQVPVEEMSWKTCTPDNQQSSSSAFKETPKIPTSENLNVLDHSTTLVGEVISNLISAVNDNLNAFDSNKLENIGKGELSVTKHESINVPQKSKSEAGKHDERVEREPATSEQPAVTPSFDQAEDIQKLDNQLSETDILGECSFITKAQTSSQKSPELCDTKVQHEEPEPSITTQEESTEISDLSESLKSVPPKKSKRSRRGSYANTEKDNEPLKENANKQLLTCEELEAEPQASNVIKKTDNPNATENASSHLTESDIILPLKKSKRANVAGTQVLKDYFSDDFSPEKKSDELQFPSFDDSFITSSFRNNIEGLIKEIDSLDDNDLDAAETSSKSTQKSDDKEVESSIKYSSEVTAVLDEKNAMPNVDFQKCVPPKKKKIEVPKDANVSALSNQTVVFDVKDKVSDSILETPKKKMQKLFENSQIIEKSEKVIELPQMSPLAKKKSFLFHQELDRLQKVEDTSNKVEVSVEKVELTESVSEEPKSGATAEDSANVLKPARKRKSVPIEHGACKKEKLDIGEQPAKPDISGDQFLSESTKDDKAVVPQASCSSTNIISDNNLESKVKVEGKNETDDNNSLTIVNKSFLLKPEHVSQLPEIKNELLSEMPTQFDVKREGMVSSLDSRVSGSSLIEQPEMVPISVAPTVMSEQDLADAQVEITSEKIINQKQPSSLGSFSGGFPKLEAKSVSLTQVKVTTDIKTKTTETVGTEFTTKAMVKEFDNRPLLTQPNTYVLKSELLDILEGNSNSSTTSSGSEQKFKTSFDNYDKQSTVQGIIDFEDAIPSQIVLSNKVKPESVLLDSPKLLQRLSMASKMPQKILVKSDVNVAEKLPALLAGKTIKRSLGVPKPGQKIIIKSQRAASKIPGSKPVILSEQIIRPAGLTTTAAAKQTSQGIKRQYEDVEDIETAFIIPKIAKKPVEEEVAQPMPVEKPAKFRSKASGKAKILQQTIISAKGSVLGEIVPHASTAVVKGPGQLQHVQIQAASDESVFDINSMPIVLSDDLLTAESIQNMPVVLSEDGVPKSAIMPKLKPNEKLVATLPKKIATALGTKQIIFKTTSSASVTPVSNKLTSKVTKAVTPSATVPFSKFSKAGSTAFIATGTTADGKPAKYVLVPPAVTPATTQVKSMKPSTIKKSTIPHKMTQSGTAPASDPSQIVGNKIMIVTNAQGQQTRVVLTPQQQKVFMQGQAGCKTKTIIKGAIPKALLETAAAVAAAGSSGVAVKTTAAISQGATASVSTTGGLLMSAIKASKTVVPPKKTIQRPVSKPQKTILIKNQLGQTVRKIQGTDDADLDRQVAEQLEAIKASARLQQANKTPEIINYTNRPIPSTSNVICNRSSAIRKTPSKKIEHVKSKIPVAATQEETPKLQEGPISTMSQQLQVASKKMDQPIAPVLQGKDSLKTETKQAAPSNETENKRPESPLRQVVIQDGLGNLTTVTVGQILAIPSETVDGQPQSYMLVTVDESGNLTPLNNDALMSLDPSLGVGGDINNVVLQVDQTQGTIAAVKPTAEPTVSTTASKENWSTGDEKSKLPALKASQREPKLSNTEQHKPAVPSITVEQQVVIGDGILPGEPGGQQLIVTGDPTATRKFLESISDGTTDLANILASAENGNVLVQADGQQILIRTNTSAQAVLGTAESNTDTTSSSLFASHKPNQDILAAALANTDVFPSTDQPTVHSSILKGSPSQVSPGSALFPMHVGNVLETSLTLSSPIMTPLEIPSTNSKKIDAEADILSQVPKNVDLPITITDPNISQTVANQQAASLGALELTLPMPDSVTSSINSPSYAYSLPSLEESVGISQKSYSTSMPLLTEDVVEPEGSASSDSGKIRINTRLKSSSSSFSPNFGTLPMLDPMTSSQEEIVKSNTFGELDSMSMLADDIIDDSQSSIGSTKLPRSSRRSEERDIIDEGLSTLGGEMCSSLSEPPPDMFDLSSITPREEEISSDLSSIPEAETLSVNSENSGEIPLQPAIIANLNDLKRTGDDSEGSDDKRPRFE
ncbi:titin homolog isoform X1 [Dendroctonus ponderosae]|uniref:titin homolog isoform X1 n=1 Tax=Dendroctonus ponderosae TaxID=77166 RepID=UPI002035276B|nr:titin homolog isoform X1 [Dendroctonus ponderosae]XP_048521389.1 titin homolog isoform X1 [Dendroctonus ponderosae]